MMCCGVEDDLSLVCGPSAIGFARVGSFVAPEMTLLDSLASKSRRVTVGALAESLAG